MASELNIVQSLRHRKQCLKQSVVSRLRMAFGVSNPSSVSVHHLKLDLLTHEILTFQLTPADLENIKYFYEEYKHEEIPSDLIRDLQLLVDWDHIALQRWRRRWIKYRRFQRFIRQPRYSAYLKAEGQFGRLFDIAQTLKWGKRALK